MDQTNLAYNIYMTIPEYAAHTKVSERSVNYLVKQGLPSVLIGRNRRILWQEADKYLLQLSKAPNKKARTPRAKRPETLAKTSQVQTVASPARPEVAA